LFKRISRYLSDLIQKVLDISSFKKKFKKNPEEFFTSRKLFVTFKSPVDAWIFKTLFNNTYKFNFSNIFRSMPKDLKEINSKFVLDPKKDNIGDLMLALSKLEGFGNIEESSDEGFDLKQSTLSVSNFFNYLNIRKPKKNQ
jgi:hypothetical protein